MNIEEVFQKLTSPAAGKLLPLQLQFVVRADADIGSQGLEALCREVTQTAARTSLGWTPATLCRGDNNSTARIFKMPFIEDGNVSPIREQIFLRVGKGYMAQVSLTDWSGTEWALLSPKLVILRANVHNSYLSEYL